MGLTHNRHRHRHTYTHTTGHSKSSCTDFTLFNMDFGFVESKQTLIHLTALDLSVYIYIYFFSFFTITLMPSLDIIIQKWEKNQTLHMNRDGWGMLVSADCFLLSEFSYQSSTGCPKPDNSNKDPVVLLEAASTLPLGH